MPAKNSNSEDLNKVESLDVYLKQKFMHRVSFNSDSGVPFFIGLASRTDCKGTVTVKGEIMQPVIGERYRLWGFWKWNDKYNTNDFNFHSFEIISNNTRAGVFEYLRRYAPELGPVKSREIVDHFGAEDVLKILRENPARVREIKGIGPATVNSLIEHFQYQTLSVDPAAFAAVHSVLDGSDIYNKTIVKIVNDFGSSATDIIKKNPYILLNYSGIGWKKVDSIATQKLKYQKTGIERQKAAILEVIQIAENQGGNTYIDKVDLTVNASNILKVNISDEAIKSLVEENRIVEFDINISKTRKRKAYSSRELWDLEKEIAFRLKLITDSCETPLPEIDVTGLEGEQVDAAKFIEKHPVSVLNGPPGSGKTTTTTKAIESFSGVGRTIILTAPTGKAAKRAQEVLSDWNQENTVQISTIHKALAPAPTGDELGVPEENAKFGREREKFVFTHNEENPIDMNDGINDETSMVGVELMARYLRAVPLGSRLLFVGDENQLSSVEAGSVFRDMIEGGIPSFSLTKPRRNSGRIAQACYEIRQGRVPKPSKEFDFPNGENWIHYEVSKPEDIAKEIIDLHDYTDKEVQVISPQNTKLPIACDHLNSLLSAKFNPKGKISDLQGKNDKYRIGDKVIRTKNGWVQLLTEGDGTLDEEGFFDAPDISWKGKDYYTSKTYIVNGDIGRVLDIVQINGKNSVIVEFENPKKLCRLDIAKANLLPAYAISTHKSQGSGFPIVFLPVHRSFHWNNHDETGLWHREMFLTMLSRAIIGAVTIGEFSAIELAISRRTISKRRTNLARFIREEFSK